MCYCGSPNRVRGCPNALVISPGTTDADQSCILSGRRQIVSMLLAPRLHLLRNAQPGKPSNIPCRNSVPPPGSSWSHITHRFVLPRNCFATVSGVILEFSRKRQTLQRYRPERLSATVAHLAHEVWRPRSLIFASISPMLYPKTNCVLLWAKRGQPRMPDNLEHGGLRRR